MTTEERLKKANQLAAAIIKHKQTLSTLESGFVDQDCSSGIMLFVNGKYVVSHDTGLVGEGPLKYTPMSYVQRFIKAEIKLRRSLVVSLEKQLQKLLKSTKE